MKIKFVPHARQFFQTSLPKNGMKKGNVLTAKNLNVVWIENDIKRFGTVSVYKSAAMRLSGVVVRVI
jgi:hypothetical protein